MRPVADRLQLTGRRALVTGGAGPIGRAVSQTLVELGATVAVLDCDPAGCADQAEALNRAGARRAIPLPCDLRDEAATRAAVAAAQRTLGGLEILVHGAAYTGTAELPGWAVPFDQQQVGAWEAALRVNLTAAFVLAQAARDALAASGHGTVVLLGSIYGVVGPDLGLYEGTTMGNPAAYAASKGGLLQLMRYLSTVLAPRIRVNAISPGGVWRHQPESFRARYDAKTPLGRMATEEDVTGAVAYLASDLSAYVTGHNLIVDGGWTAW